MEQNNTTEYKTKSILSGYKNDNDCDTLEIEELSPDQFKYYKEILQKSLQSEQDGNYIEAQWYLELYEYYIQKKHIMSEEELENTTNASLIGFADWENFKHLLTENKDKISEFKYIFATLGYKNNFQIITSKNISISLHVLAENDKGIKIAYEYISHEQAYSISFYTTQDEKASDRTYLTNDGLKLRIVGEKYTIESITSILSINNRKKIVQIEKQLLDK